MARTQALDRPFQGGDARAAGFDHKHRRLGQTGEDQGVGQADHGRAVEDHIIEAFLAQAYQIDHFGGGQEFHGVGRNGSTGHQIKIGDLGRLGDLKRFGVSGQIVGQAVGVGQLKSLVQRGISQVAIDQQHLVFGLGEDGGNADRRGRLALAWAGTGKVQNPGRARRRREEQRRAHGAIGLRQGAFGIRKNKQANCEVFGGLFGAYRRNHAQHRRPGAFLHILADFNGIVQGLEQEGQQYPPEQSQRDGNGQVLRQTGLVFFARHLGRIDYRDVVGGNPGGHAHLFHAL